MRHPGASLTLWTVVQQGVEVGQKTCPITYFPRTVSSFIGQPFAERLETRALRREFYLNGKTHTFSERRKACQLCVRPELDNRPETAYYIIRYHRSTFACIVYFKATNKGPASCKSLSFPAGVQTAVDQFARLNKPDSPLGLLSGKLYQDHGHNFYPVQQTCHAVDRVEATDRLSHICILRSLIMKLVAQVSSSTRRVVQPCVLARVIRFKVSRDDHGVSGNFVASSRFISRF